MGKTLDLSDHLKELVDEGRDLVESLQEEFTIKGIHKLRVTLRRLRTSILLLPPKSLPDDEKKLLKKLWKRLGTVRDLDVAKDLTEKFGFPLDEIKRDRLLAREKLRKTLLDHKTGRLLDQIERLTLRPETSRVNPVPYAKKLYADLMKTPAEAESLHALRIIIKKIRYLREALQLPIEEFKIYQDTLGAFQDMAVYRERFPHSYKVQDKYQDAREKALEVMRPAFIFAMKAIQDIENKFGEPVHLRKAV